jgi:hypothetical protein
MESLVADLQLLPEWRISVYCVEKLWCLKIHCVQHSRDHETFISFHELQFQRALLTDISPSQSAMVGIRNFSMQ